MRLIFFTQNEAPFRMKWMDELARYMEVRVYHLGEYENNIDPKYISYHTKRADTKKVTKKIGGITLYNIGLIQLKKTDLILLDGYGFIGQQVLILYLLIKGLRFGITVDGGFIPDAESKVKTKIKKFYISHADYYLSTSSDTDMFLKYYGAEEGKIYRHRFSNITQEEILERPLSSKEKSNIRKELNIFDKFTIIAVGKLIYPKGFDVLFKAVGMIEDDMQVIVVGGGNSNVRENYNDDRIIILPFLEKDLLYKYMQSSDVFVLPTRKDVWGLVIGEAMANGLPVITTNMCLAGVDMVKNGVNGYIVPVDDADELKKAILRIKSSNLFEMGKNNINVIEKYAIQNASKDDLRIFSKLKL